MLASIPQAHSEVVTSLTFSPHVSSTLCSTSGDDSAALWDTRTGANITRLHGYHTGPVNHALFLPSDPHTLLTAADDRRIALWDSRHTAGPVAQLSGFHDGVNKMLLLPGSLFPSCGLSTGAERYLIASACDDGRVYVHALLPFSASEVPPTPGGALPSAGTLVDSFWASTSTVNDIIQTPNPRVLMTASEDGALRTWRLLFDVNATTEDRLLSSLDEFDSAVNHVVTVPQGWMSEGDGPSGSPLTPAARGGGGGSDGEAGELEAAGGGAGAAEAAGDAAGNDGRLAAELHAARAAEERHGLRRWVLAACAECTFGVDLSVADGVFGEGARSFVGHGDYVRGLEFTRAGTLLTVSDDSTAMEWSLSTGEAIRQVKLHEGLVMASAVNATGDALASGTDSGEIRVWQLPFQTERLGGQ